MNSNWIACLSLFSLPFLYAPEAAAKPPAKSPKDAVHEAAAAPDNPLLAKMKTLVGSWKSSMGQMSTTTTYKTTGGGKCVAETVALGPHKEMLTMYCADGDALVATHYCDSGNQPR